MTGQTNSLKITSRLSTDPKLYDRPWMTLNGLKWMVIIEYWNAPIYSIWLIIGLGALQNVRYDDDDTICLWVIFLTYLLVCLHMWPTEKCGKWSLGSWSAEYFGRCYVVDTYVNKANLWYTDTLWCSLHVPKKWALAFVCFSFFYILFSRPY